MVAYNEIQDTLKYIEEHIAEPLDVQALADKAHLSPYYFQRLFTRIVGRPIAEYLKQRRLARTLDPLRLTDERILDIALAVGFGSHETFIRAFKASFDMTPDEFRKDGHPVPGLKLSPVLMPDVTMDYKLVAEGVPLVADGVILEVTRRVYTEERLYAGFSVRCVGGSPNNLNPGVAWDYFTRKPASAIPFLHPLGHNAGIAMEFTEEGFTYFAGSLVTGRDPVFAGTRDWPGFDGLPDYLSPGYVSVPPGEYLICTYTAEDFDPLVVEAMSMVSRYFYGTHIPQHGLEAEPPAIELYDERCLRWHPNVQEREGNLNHFAPCEPRLSQWEGPEMELQVKLKR